MDKEATRAGITETQAQELAMQVRRLQQSLNTAHARVGALTLELERLMPLARLGVQYQQDGPKLRSQISELAAKVKELSEPTPSTPEE